MHAFLQSPFFYLVFIIPIAIIVYGAYRKSKNTEALSEYWMSLPSLDDYLAENPSCKTKNGIKMKWEIKMNVLF